jgi:hypothetical protein
MKARILDTASAPLFVDGAIFGPSSSALADIAGDSNGGAQAATLVCNKI